MALPRELVRNVKCLTFCQWPLSIQKLPHQLWPTAGPLPSPAQLAMGLYPSRVGSLECLWILSINIDKSVWRPPRITTQWHSKRGSTDFGSLTLRVVSENFWQGIRKVRSYKSIGKNEYFSGIMSVIALNIDKKFYFLFFIFLQLRGKIPGRSSYRFLCLLSINLKISNAILHVGLHQQILHLYLF